MKTSIPILATAVLLLAGAATAQSQQTYLYDANGRLAAATTARATGNSTLSYFVQDDADNRTDTGAFAATPPSVSYELPADYTLAPSQKLTSANGQYTMTLEASGDLVIRNNVGAAVWNSCTAQGRSWYVRIPSATGVLTIHDTRGVPLWTAGSPANSNAKLTLENTGVAVLRAPGGSVLWQSTTSCI